MMMRKYIFFILFLTLPLSLFAEKKEVRQSVRKGNSLFNKEEFQKAEIEYRKALEESPENTEATYDLANTLYRTERGEEAAKLYQELLQKIELLPTERAADVAHNAGNVMMTSQNYAQAVELFKESLRRRPTDDETRYNLALAQKLLQEQEQQGDNGSDDQEEEKDNQEQEQEQQQNQQNPNEEQQKDQEQKQQEQPQQEERMSRDNAEQILEAYLENEKKTQEKIEKIKQQQQQGKRSRPKNW